MLCGLEQRTKKHGEGCTRDIEGMDEMWKLKYEGRIGEVLDLELRGGALREAQEHCHVDAMGAGAPRAI